MKKCTLPFTGLKCVHRIVTELAVLDLTDKGFLLVERAPGVNVEEIQSATEGSLKISSDVKEITLS